MIPTIKSPLRYPGGKSKALNQILPIIPDFDEFREPFVGGGSVFFALKQLYPDKKFWINDWNNDLYSFWKYCQNDMDNLILEISKIKKETIDGRELFKSLTDENRKDTDFEKAIRFFILNRITFSGTVESGGYSQQAFEKRFTDSSIHRILKIQKLMKGVLITNLDYVEVINKIGKNVFIFLDPPYLSTVKSKLYGKKGDLHSLFDHEKFAENMKQCKHNWLITYDNSPEVKELFNFANIYEWELQYGMNNYKQNKALKGKELFISNYEIPSLINKKVETKYDISEKCIKSGFQMTFS
jgi:DNA adenine methylase